MCESTSTEACEALSFIIDFMSAEENEKIELRKILVEQMKYCTSEISPQSKL